MNSNIWETAFIEDSKFSILENLAKPERWNYREDSSSVSHPILRNYITHTYKRLYNLHDQFPNDNYINIVENHICFNTGLYSRNYEKIYALMEPNNSMYKQSYRLKGFFKGSAYELQGISKLPERAIYFQDISEVIYDTKCDLRINVDHILGDEENKQRIPDEYKGNKMLPMLLGNMAVDYAKMRIEENYKTAVPQFYNDKVQLLVPISLNDPSVVDLALAVSREGDVYMGRTCLTLDMAYNNARLIAKPESEWL